MEQEGRGPAVDAKKKNDDDEAKAKEEKATGVKAGQEKHDADDSKKSGVAAKIKGVLHKD
jgi:hypothetical protein